MGDTETSPRQALLGVRTEMQDLQHKQRELLRQLELVGTSLEHAETRYAELTNRCALISSLPDELLAKIFALCQDPAPALPVELKPVEVIVSQVTQRWRRISINDPALWKTISIRTSRSTVKLATYLERSRPHPIDVHLQIRQSSHLNQDVRSDIDRIMVLLLRHSSRLAAFRVTSDSRKGLNAIIPRLRDLSVPLLHSITLHLLTTDERYNIVEHRPDSEHSFYDIFRRSAPLLSTVTLDGIGLGSLMPPPHSLVNLEIRNCHHFSSNSLLTERQLREVLAASPRLTRLVFFDSVLDSSAWQDSSLMHMPCLREIELGRLRSHTSGILSHLSAPQLQKLTIRGQMDEFDILEAFVMAPEITRGNLTYANLWNLSLFDVASNRHVWDLMFQIFPSITHFTSHTSSSAQFSLLASTLSASEPDSVPWPDLSVLAVCAQSYDEDAMQTLVTTREAAGVPIKSVNLYFSGYQWLRDRVELVFTG